jgi:sugar lactone lactonase YvrE
MNRILLPALAFILLVPAISRGEAISAPPDRQRLLYVGSPGVQNLLKWGGHGVLVFDIDHDHRFVKRISLDGYGLSEKEADKGKVLNIKGICASAATGRLYVSTLRHLICIDLPTEEVLWQKTFDKGCDRMAISPDGTTIYQPSFENDCWYVVDAASGDEIQRIEAKSKAHNTVYAPDGKCVYLAGLGSPILSIAETDNHTIERTVGPFGNFIRPYTINGAQTLIFANVNKLLGFEVGDLRTGQVIHRVEITGVKHGAPDRHGCPSHGIALTPDERELWVGDSFNRRVHIFDATVMPPTQGESIELREQPGWINFSIDGTLAYPSTGDVIDVKSHKIIAELTDEEDRPVESEKLLEIDFAGGRPVVAGNQFGLGQVDSH